MAQRRAFTLEASAIFLMAVAIGALGGLLSVGFQRSVLLLQELVMGSAGPFVETASSLTPPQRLLIPAFGGLLAGLLFLLIRNRRGPFGIADVMEIVVTRQGRIRVRDSLVQIMTSACSIATGASIGKEGANSQLGATTASIIGRLTRSDSRTRTVLLGCGIAAGMAVSYNAPIAGALFVMEVVLGNFAMDVFAPVVVASVTATLVRNLLLVPDPLYATTAELASIHHAVAAVVLGLICGAGGYLFRRSLDAGAWLFRRSRLPLIATLALGGLLVGAVGIYYPQTWGNGQEAINVIRGDNVDGGPAALQLVLAILIFKVVATAATTGSGALGGVFTPTLVVGAALGALFGAMIDTALPPNMGGGETAFHQVSFSLVGMAGLCAATTHAPITAILLVFEMTGDYGMILPLMVCSIVASITSRLIHPDSIYSARLRARGHHLAGGIEDLAMQSNRVADLMRADTDAVTETTTFDDVMVRFGSSRRGVVYVEDAKRRLLGHIRLQDVKSFINDQTINTVVIAADLTRPCVMASPDETLAALVARFDEPEIEELPVVDGEGRLQGRITRQDVIACISDEVLGNRKLRTRFRTADREAATFVQLPEGTRIARVAVHDDLFGRAFDSVDLLADAGLIALLLVRHEPDGTEIRRLPSPQDVFESGDDLIVLGSEIAIEAWNVRTAGERG